VFAAMMLRAEAMIGFIIATKAILRLPETREPGTRELAEYYLAGSFASLAWAVLVAVATRWQVQGHP
jgi:hypothetical protein